MRKTDKATGAVSGTQRKKELKDEETNGKKRSRKSRKIASGQELRLRAGASDVVDRLCERAAFVLECLECGEDRPGQKRLLEDTMRYLASEVAHTSSAVEPENPPSDDGWVQEQAPYSVTPFACEAPTGIGKSFVFLTAAFTIWNDLEVPSLLSTYSKVLQMQYERNYYDFKRRLAKSESFVQKWDSPFYDPRSSGRDILDGWKMTMRMGKGNYLCLRRLERVKKLFGMTGSVAWGRENVCMDRLGFYDFLTRYEAMGDIGQNMELWPVHMRDDPCAQFVKADVRVPCKGCPAEYVQRCRYLISTATDAPLVLSNHALSLASFTSLDEYENALAESEELEGKKKRFPSAMFCDEGHHLMGLSTSAGVIFRMSERDLESLCLWTFPETRFPKRTAKKAKKRDNEQDSSIEDSTSEEITSEVPINCECETNQPNDEDMDRDYRAVSEYLSDRKTLRESFSKLLFVEGDGAPNLSSWRTHASAFLDETQENHLLKPGDILTVLSSSRARRARFTALTEQISESAMLFSKLRLRLERMLKVTENNLNLELVSPCEGELIVRRSGRQKIEVGTKGRSVHANAVSALVILSGTLSGSGRGDASFRDESGLFDNDTSNEAGSATPVLIERLPEQFDLSRLQVWIPGELPRPSQDFSSFNEEDVTPEKIRDPWLLGVVRFLQSYVPPYLDAGLGGVLVLSTSLSRVALYGKVLSNASRDRQWSVHVAGSGESSKKHIRRFLGAEGCACLIGSESFREGFDAPGKTLTWVISDRLPYERADERMARRLRILEESGRFDAEAEALYAQTQGESKSEDEIHTILDRAKRQISFDHISDIMEMRLRQTVGRVLRTHEDAGFFTLLDSRACPGGHYATNSGVRAALSACPNKNAWWIDLPSTKAWIMERAKPFLRQKKVID